MAASASSACTDLIVYPSSGVTNNVDSVSTDDDDNSQTFVGLSNQGATCYMNSLLQTLFMTPEFRDTLYKWTYNPEKDGDEDYCIPLQLQKLFGKLQLSSSRSVDTVALTKSFGWEGNERFQQQDVQELCRVLFDALEECFKGNESVENFIDELYAGELVDYIKCMDVDYQSERKDKFLDYSVAILPFGAEESMKSVAECIEHYLEPEILDGDNQYFADSVGRKVDAIKGLKFGRLPQVMSVQLKRFVFDFSGESIVQKKINDKVTFPLILDMNKYVSRQMRELGEGEGRDETRGLEQEEEVESFDTFLRKRIAALKSRQEAPESEAEDSHSAGSLPALVDCNGAPLAPSSPPPPGTGAENLTNLDPSVDEYFDHTVDPLQLIANKGQWVYQLYGVLVHSGAISGGHYFVYIRDVSTNKWWNFNDSSVSEVSEKEVLRAQGGATTVSGGLGTPSSSHGSRHGAGTYATLPSQARRAESCSNAYMLMYRKVTEATLAVEFPSSESVPEYIRAEVRRQEEETERRRAEAKERLNNITVAVHWKGEKHHVRTKKTALFKEFLQQVWSQLPIYADEREVFAKRKEVEGGEVPVDVVRLRVFNAFHKVSCNPFDVQCCGDKTLESLRISFNLELCVEVKGEGEWEEYEANGIMVILKEFDMVANAFKQEQRVVRVAKVATLGDLLSRITAVTSPDMHPVRLMKLTVLAQSNVTAVELVEESKLLSDLNIQDWSTVYCEQNSCPIDKSPAVEAYRVMTNAMDLNVQDCRTEGVERGKLTKIFADKRWNIPQLRAHIRDVFQFNETEEFRICRFSKPQLEIVGGEEKQLSTLGFYKGMTCVMKSGPPMLPGLVNVKVFVFKAGYRAGVNALYVEKTGRVVVTAPMIRSGGDGGDGDRVPAEEGSEKTDVSEKPPVTVTSCSYGSDMAKLCPTYDQFKFLTVMTVGDDTLVDDFREKLFEKLKTLGVMSESDSVKQVRVRLKAGCTCTEVLRGGNGVTLKDNKVPLFLDRHIAVQVLDHEESLPPLDSGDALVNTQRYLRSSRTLSPPTEVLLKGSMSVANIASALGTYYSVPLESMRVLVAHPYSDIKMCDLHLPSPCLRAEWIDPVREHRTMSDVQWHLTYGDVILIQDEDEPLRALTPVEEESVAKQKKSSIIVPRLSDQYTPPWFDEATPAAPTPAQAFSPGVPVPSAPSAGPAPRVIQRGVFIKTQKARERDLQNLRAQAQTSASATAADLDDIDNVGGCNILFGDVD